MGGKKVVVGTALLSLTVFSHAGVWAWTKVYLEKQGLPSPDGGIKIVEGNSIPRSLPN